MEKLSFSKVINAPKEKVWDTMLNQDTYQVWTEPFMAGSQYVGDWNKGSKILFLAPTESGEMAGMVSRIAENRPYEFLSIEHLGEVKNGVEDTTSDAVKQWAGAHENYSFKEVQLRYWLKWISMKILRKCSKVCGQKLCRNLKNWQRNKNLIKFFLHNSQSVIVSCQ